MFKLLMSWNIRKGRERDCFEFIVQEFAPGLISLGIKPTDAWYTQYGDRPQILAGGTVEDLADLEDTLRTEKWNQLQRKLLTYVTDYEQKVIRANGSFQL